MNVIKTERSFLLRLNGSLRYIKRVYINKLANKFLLNSLILNIQIKKFDRERKPYHRWKEVEKLNA